MDREISLYWSLWEKTLCPVLPLSTPCLQIDQKIHTAANNRPIPWYDAAALLKSTCTSVVMAQDVHIFWGCWRNPGRTCTTSDTEQPFVCDHHSTHTDLGTLHTSLSYQCNNNRKTWRYLQRSIHQQLLIRKGCVATSYRKPVQETGLLFKKLACCSTNRCNGNNGNNNN